MILLIFICVFFVLLIIIVLTAVVKISRSKYRAILIGTCAVVVLLFYCAWKNFEERFALSFVPDGLGVSTILYSKEESWGYWWLPLPGDNEFGVRIYALSESVAQQILKQGPAFFATMPSNTGRASREWRGVYRKWVPTPFVSPDDIKSQQRSFPLSYAEVDPEGGFTIDPAFRIQLRRILRSPGSYYAFGRVGIIVVSPGERRVVFMYN